MSSDRRTVNYGNAYGHHNQSYQSQDNTRPETPSEAEEVKHDQSKYVNAYSFGAKLVFLWACKTH